MLNQFFSLPENLSAQVTSNLDLDFGPENNMLLQAYVPGANSVPDQIDEPDIQIIHQESEERKLVHEGINITIYDQWRGKISFDIYHLLYSASRVKLLEKNMYPVHSSCVESNGGHLLIIGHSGSGKTTTALELVKNDDAKFSSGNKTVVAFDGASMRMIAGTPTVTIRQSDLAKYDSIIANCIPYYNRLAFHLNLEKYTQLFRGEIRAVVLLRLHDGLNDFTTLNPSSALHTLYPYFLDTVNADTIVCNGNGVFVGTPPIGSQERLVKRLQHSLQYIPVYSVTGPMSFVTNVISKL